MVNGGVLPIIDYDLLVSGLFSAGNHQVFRGFMSVFCSSASTRHYQRLMALVVCIMSSAVCTIFELVS
jgi:hypothetical protein